MTFDGLRCVSAEGERIKQMRVAQAGIKQMRVAQEGNCCSGSWTTLN